MNGEIHAGSGGREKPGSGAVDDELLRQFSFRRTGPLQERGGPSFNGMRWLQSQCIMQKAFSQGLFYANENIFLRACVLAMRSPAAKGLLQG